MVKPRQVGVIVHRRRTPIPRCVAGCFEHRPSSRYRAVRIAALALERLFPGWTNMVGVHDAEQIGDARFTRRLRLRYPRDPGYVAHGPVPARAVAYRALNSSGDLFLTRPDLRE